MMCYGHSLAVTSQDKTKKAKYTLQHLIKLKNSFHKVQIKGKAGRATFFSPDCVLTSSKSATAAEAPCLLWRWHLSWF